MPTVNYDWDEIEDNIVEEFNDAGATVAEYTTEPEQFGNVVSQRRDGEDSFFHYDGQGSTLALTNGNGDKTDTLGYNAFGEVTSQSGDIVSPFQYCGQNAYYRDVEYGEYLARRRVLQAQHGRWMSEDILVCGTSTYAYANENPIRYIDPSGLLSVEIVGRDADRTCGLANVTFKFHLKGNFSIPATGPGPYKGYIVQYNEVYLKSLDCPKKGCEDWKAVFDAVIYPTSTPVLKFWEAWEIESPKDIVTDFVQNPGRPTTTPPSGGLRTYGHYRALGTIRYFPKETYDVYKGIGDLSTDKTWGKGKVPDAGPTWSTYDLPKWWENSEFRPIEETAVRRVGIQWCCCDCCCGFEWLRNESNDVFASGSPYYTK